MAKKAVTDLTPADVDESLRYEVELRRAIPLKRMVARPGGLTILSGKIIKEHADAIERIAGLAR